MAGPQASGRTDSDGPEITSPGSRAQLDMWMSELDAQNQTSRAPESHDAQPLLYSRLPQGFWPSPGPNAVEMSRDVRRSAHSSLESSAHTSAAEQLQSHTTSGAAMSFSTTTSMQPVHNLAWRQAGASGPSEPSASQPSMLHSVDSQQIRAPDAAALQPRAKSQPLLPTAFEVRMMHTQVMQQYQPRVSSHKIPGQNQPVRYLQLGRHIMPGASHVPDGQALHTIKPTAPAASQAMQPRQTCPDLQQPQTFGQVVVSSASGQLEGAPQPHTADTMSMSTQLNVNPAYVLAGDQQQQQHASGIMPPAHSQSSGPPANPQMPGTAGLYMVHEPNMAPSSNTLPINSRNSPSHRASAGASEPPRTIYCNPNSHASDVPYASSHGPPPPQTLAHPAPPSHIASAGPSDGGNVGQTSGPAPCQPAPNTADAPAELESTIAPSHPSFTALQRFHVGKQVLPTALLDTLGMVTLQQLMQAHDQRGDQLSPRLIQLLRDCQAVYQGLIRLRAHREDGTFSLPGDLEVCLFTSSLVTSGPITHAKCSDMQTQYACKQRAATDVICSKSMHIKMPSLTVCSRFCSKPGPR